MFVFVLAQPKIVTFRATIKNRMVRCNFKTSKFLPEIKIE